MKPTFLKLTIVVQCTTENAEELCDDLKEMETTNWSSNPFDLLNFQLCQIEVKVDNPQ